MVDGRREQIRHLSSAFSRAEAQLADPTITLKDCDPVDVLDECFMEPGTPALAVVAESAPFAAVPRALSIFVVCVFVLLSLR